jgi:hypothetical protein
MEQMNERIQLLIEQATVTEKGPPNWELTNNTVIRRLDRELLTQLVIKECAEVYRTNLRPGRTLYPTEFSAALNQHFGTQDE